MGRKLIVAVLCGGPSSEYEVSLNSGRNVFKFIDRKKFLPTLVILQKDFSLRIGSQTLPFPSGLRRFDVVFNALHGQFGEDGVLQSILDLIRIPYTGSDTASSFIGMDKWLSKLFFNKSGLVVPSSRLFKQKEFPEKVKFPLVAKPRRGGSSVGVELIYSRKQLKKTFEKIWKSGDDVILERYIRGRELTVGVIEKKGKIISLPVIEIVPKKKHKFFDYQAKYLPGHSDEIVPAPISRSLAGRLQRSAIQAHKSLECSVYSRSDFMVLGKKIYILEVNTLPGLTQNSLVPKAAQAAGMSFGDLITLIIKSSLERF
ncbi:MAG: D-alanine-D-alanine ligase [Candidatus Wolfebacteria bacterium GW2011_GWC1_43_10]|uniref:D-alanine--D-alanine ligase n=1 Tax=Candidatus Wolfebacteria bacterium GW2011_GWC1_43_10 TaxID=1619011 RepID=A0A0G1CB89_9BACT|nr:MAG: D-alanine-D-alanine ligase [Candidatus Wolfebacteria bacterium GW2011_GWC1_43_10]